MDAYRNPSPYAELSSIGITAGKLARVENGRGMRLRVETGSVWITRDHCFDDVIVNAGESFRIEHDGLTLVQTMLRAPFALVTFDPAMPVARPLSGRITAAFWHLWCGMFEPRSRPTTAAL